MLFKEASKCLQSTPNYIFDEACLDVLNNCNETTTVWGQYTECHNCNFQKYATLEPNGKTSILVNTRYPLDLYFNIGEKNLCK